MHSTVRQHSIVIGWKFEKQVALQFSKNLQFSRLLNLQNIVNGLGFSTVELGNKELFGRPRIFP